MAEQDPVATTALVVSLIALVIAIGQLSQQLLGTADGYRRCKAEVIGVWATRTHRRWLWYEFRFETKYTTPDIDLVAQRDSSEKKKNAGRGKGPFWLNDSDPVVEVDLTVHPKPNKNGEHVGENRELLVSWIPLLQELYNTYNAYRPGQCSCSKLNKRGSSKNTPKQRYLDALKESINHASDTTEKSSASSEGSNISSRALQNSVRTDVAVTYRVLSWDFMPSEVVRPLASTCLGTLVVLGVRLDMR